MGQVKGFSLIEIMVVLVIMGMMSAIVVPAVMGALRDGEITRLKSDFSSIETALQMYKLHNHRYPTTEQGLEALVEMPEHGPRPRRWTANAYLSRLPLDPWDNAYLYFSPGENGRPFEVISLGADAVSGGVEKDTDVSNWDTENDSDS